LKSLIQNIYYNPNLIPTQIKLQLLTNENLIAKWVVYALRIQSNYNLKCNPIPFQGNNLNQLQLKF
jgi:hypothetical protein